MGEKKQLLFVCYGLGIGGIEKCLVNLLNALPREQFDVDVMLMSPQYNMKPMIREKTFFYNEFDYILYSGGAMEQIRKRGGIVRNWKKMIPYTLFHVMDQREMEAWKLFRRPEKTYDIAVAYSQNGYPLYYVIDKVRAKRKILWYHNGAYEAGEKEQRSHRKYFPRFDQIVAVSQDCARVLKEKLPYVQDKIMVLHNLCDSSAIRSDAKAFRPERYDSGKKHIVSIGRMTREKGALLALEACRMLRDSGKDICWHWVGDGDQREEILRRIREMGLENSFLLEGSQDNPYPYLDAADIYVQPSFYEAYSTTVTEAKVLLKPMVVTDVGGMRDQLTDGENALIVPVEAKAIADGVAKLLDDEALCGRFSRMLQKESYDGQTALQPYLQSVFA